MIKISRCQRFTRYLLAATLLLGTTALPALAEPRGTHWLNVGDTIEVDKLQASTPAGAMWTTGTILEVNQKMNSYLVDVKGVKMTIINNDKWIKPATGGHQGASQPKADQPPAQAKPQQPRQAVGGAEWDKRKGLGAPPSGRYVVNKAGYGYGLDIGELIIHGNTYQGIVRGGGASAPYTLDGDKIVWTNGLEGLPHNAPLVASKYIGADEHGRALIRIWYRGNRGALEVLDAYRVGQ